MQIAFRKFFNSPRLRQRKFFRRKNSLFMQGEEKSWKTAEVELKMLNFRAFGRMPEGHWEIWSKSYVLSHKNNKIFFFSFSSFYFFSLMGDYYTYINIPHILKNISNHIDPVFRTEFSFQSKYVEKTEIQWRFLWYISEKLVSYVSDSAREKMRRGGGVRNVTGIILQWVIFAKSQFFYKIRNRWNHP